MPTYEYQCKSCNNRFEQYQSMKDAALRKCPSCGKNTLERLIGTGAAIIFKGSGFYQTDYRSDSYKKAAEADGSAGKAAEKPAEVKSETTSAGDFKAAPAAEKPSNSEPTRAKPASKGKKHKH